MNCIAIYIIDNCLFHLYFFNRIEYKFTDRINNRIWISCADYLFGLFTNTFKPQHIIEI